MKRLHLLLILSLCSLFLNARDYITYTLNKSDGLSDSYVRDIVQDQAKGYLWFATLNGLNKYDGYKITNVITREAMQQGDIPDNRIVNVYSWGKDFVIVKLRGNVFAFYNLHQRRFTFHTENQDSKETFRNACFLDKQVWLFDNINGCMSIKVNDNHFQTKKYNKANHLLPSSQVNSVAKGLNGCIWIATSKGLVRIDHKGKSTNINTKYNFVAQVVHQGKEYFITDQGMIFTYYRGKLITLSIAHRLPHNVLVKNVIAYQEKLLLATTGMIYEYHIKKASLQESKEFLISNANVIEDNQHHKILINNNGLLYYFTQNHHWYSKLPSVQAPADQNLNYKIVTTQDNQVMVCSNGFGLFILSPKKEMSATQLVPAMHYPTNTDYLLSIYEDKLGNVWISEEDLGVLCLSRRNIMTEQIAYPAIVPFKYDDHFNTVRMLKKTSDGKIFSCSLNGQLTTFDGKKLTTNPVQYGSVLSTAITKEGIRLWGTRQGLFVGNKQYKHDKNIPNSISSDKISDILYDKKGRIWLACYGGGLDLALPYKDGLNFLHFFTQSREVKEARVLCQDHKGNIWLGTGEGVFVFNPDKLATRNIKNIHLVVNKNPKMDEIHAIMEDSKHRIWVAITGTGVALYDNAGKTPKLINVFTHADGLGDSNVQSFVEDNQGRIWVGTNFGVSCYNEKVKRFNNYLINYSMLGNRCMENSACKLDNGMVAFGTKEGIAYFYPNHMSRSRCNSQTAITLILVNGIPLEQMPQDSYTIEDNQLELSHDQNSLVINFSDFTFEKDHNSQYSYWLEGYEQDWSIPSREAAVTYRKLPPGNYKFHLRSCDAQGEWNSEKIFSITIRPPFWATWYAWIFYIFLICGITYFVWKQLEEKRQLKEKIRLEQKLTDFKIHFFTNISHEFRTPLTIILGAMENIREKGELPGQIKLPISNMMKSTHRMKRLIDRLLDFTKLQEQKMTLKVEETEIISFVRDIYSYFQQIAQNKHIEFIFSTFAKELTLPVDKKILDTIVCNLISNALKYTPVNGEVSIKIEKDEKNNQLLIHVIDNGIGIKEEKRQQLFMRFMQSSFSYDSIGIGLYLSNKMAQIHHGAITYQNRPTGGSIFTLQLPATASIYTEQEFAQQTTALLINDEKEKVWQEDYKEIAGKSLNDKHVLIVEDDADVLNFLCQELKHYFIIHTACDGKEALEKLDNPRPDLIISDVMMPIMNGYELTRKLKTSDAYYDIPVILLTALNEENKKVKGYDAGADEYIEKPFSMKMLVSRAAQLIHQYEKMKANFSQMAKEEPQRVQSIIKEERDKKFIDILDSWIMKHLSDPDLNIDHLASSLSYGRSTFYAKVSNLTGMTPNNYVRQKRLNEAKRLLEEAEDNISEIAYKTGFGNPYYFTRLFKKEFGMTPSAYRKGT